jgi:V8-like Glu-specific endopeptidase
MKKRLLLLSALFVVGSMSAQTSDLGNPLTFNGKIQKTKVFQEMPPLDIDAELLSQNQSGEKMLRFGKEFDVELNVLESATKTVLPSGDVLYQLGISCPNALSVNLVFSKFNLAAGSKLFLTDANSNDFIGSYTSFNNNPNQMLGTELLYSSKVIVELVEPKGKIGTSSLVISTVVAGFRNLDEMAKALNDAGNCHYDANCPQGAAWVNQKNSVAMMVNGGGFCTGALVNNTTGTIIPYFLSANHCGTNPGGWVFRFRWESPVGQTVCGTGGNSVNGPETMNVNGGTLRASWAGSDFTLTELNSAPNPAWGIYYSGWDNSNAAVTSAVGIHHPSGDIKKISFENDPLTSSSWSGTAANSHWHVPGWDLACTEPGSSGSPLFDQNHRVIGQLHGGASACGASDMSDEYGKFSVSWTGNGTNTTRLSNWLDPSNTGATAIEGVDPAGPAAALDAAINNPQGVSGTYCTATVTPQVTIMNSGTDVLTSATISYGYDGLLNQSYPWTGSLAQFASVTITLPAATLAGGNHTHR